MARSASAVSLLTGSHLGGFALPAPLRSRRMDRLLDAYERDHRHPTNRLLHFVAVPLIYFCVVAVLAELPRSELLAAVPGGWASLAAIPISIYYLRRSVPAWVTMVVFTTVCVAVIVAMRAVLPIPVWNIALLLLVALIIVQDVGHRIEGKRPSFLTDVQFLLIGPVWVFSKLLRPLGVRY